MPQQSHRNQFVFDGFVTEVTVNPKGTGYISIAQMGQTLRFFCKEEVMAQAVGFRCPPGAEPMEARLSGLLRNRPVSKEGQTGAYAMNSIEVQVMQVAAIPAGGK